MLLQGVEEIGLVFIGIHTFEHSHRAVGVTGNAGVVPGGDVVCTQFQRQIEEGFELDFLVAHDVGVGGTPGAVFIQKIGEHPIPIFAGEIAGMQLDTQLVGNRLRIGKVNGSGTVVLGVVFLPIFHEQTFDLIALFQQ